MDQKKKSYPQNDELQRTEFKLTKIFLIMKEQKLEQNQ